LFILAGAIGLASIPVLATDASEFVSPITDPEIREGVRIAIEKNILPAATQEHYRGHFEITADGGSYGKGATWPGLDSWQMAGAYLLLGRTQLVLDYFEFVRASQAANGAISFAIRPGHWRADERYHRSLRYPEGLYTYKPPKREGLSEFALETKQWMRQFDHWQPIANPFRILGSVSYVLTAGEIYQHTQSSAWLEDHLPSVESAALSIFEFKSENGLISGSGFYTELPPRHGWDGVSQCYAIHAFRELAKLYRTAGLKIFLYFLLHCFFSNMFGFMRFFRRQNKFIVLSADHYCIDPQRIVIVIVLNSNLRFGIGPQVFHLGSLVTYCRKFLQKPVRQLNCQGHKVVHFAAGIAKHHSLVTCTLIFRLFADNSLVYVTRLFMNCRYDSARVAVEAILCFCISYLAYDASCTFLVIDPAGCANLTATNNQTCCHECLTRNF
jgi:hypothetical protein